MGGFVPHDRKTGLRQDRRSISRLAALCRAQADHTALCEYRPALLKMAERWERDAERVLADGYMIATSLTMIDSISPCGRALIEREQAPSVDGVVSSVLQGEWCGREDSNLHGLPR